MCMNAKLVLSRQPILWLRFLINREIALPQTGGRRKQFFEKVTSYSQLVKKPKPHTIAFILFFPTTLSISGQCRRIHSLPYTAQSVY